VYTRLLLSAAGTDDYYSVPLPSASALENVVVSLSPNVNGNQLRLRYALEVPTAWGPISSRHCGSSGPASGDVQASVAWTGASDVDLHVFDPSGEEVYFGNRDAASGGQLDIDSNAACELDNTNVENIFWPLNGAPAGQYRVELHYFDDCNVPRSDWVVTVLLKGQAPAITTGSFVGAEQTAATAPVVIGTSSTDRSLDQPGHKRAGVSPSGARRPRAFGELQQREEERQWRDGRPLDSVHASYPLRHGHPVEAG
jgi:hypothetical protein